MNDFDTFADAFLNYMEAIRNFEGLSSMYQKALIHDFKRDTNIIISAMEELKHENE